jgi:hypothetical protein
MYTLRSQVIIDTHFRLNIQYSSDSGASWHHMAWPSNSVPLNEDSDRWNVSQMLKGLRLYVDLLRHFREQATDSDIRSLYLAVISHLESTTDDEYEYTTFVELLNNVISLNSMVAGFELPSK